MRMHLSFRMTKRIEYDGNTEREKENTIKNNFKWKIQVTKADMNARAFKFLLFVPVFFPIYMHDFRDSGGADYRQVFHSSS